MAELGYTFPQELQGTRRAKKRDKGSSGTRLFLVEWENANGSWAPKVRKSRFTEGTELEGKGTWMDRLICCDIDYEGCGPGKSVGGVEYPYSICKVTVQYSDNISTSSEDIEISGSSRVLEIGGGRVWEDGTPCKIPIYKVCPQGSIRITRYFPHHPLRQVGLLNRIGLINRYSWRQYPSETIRFDYPDVHTVYDDEKDALMDHVVFLFTYEKYGHNREWKDGDYQRTDPPLYETTQSFERMLAGGW